MNNEEWAEGHRNRRILEKTIKELVARIHPDLITISGDLAWAGQELAYEHLADLLDTFDIPWAPVWGNHDNQLGAESVDRVATRYLQHKNCIYEKGDPAIGNGNYVIAIAEGERIVSGILMMDSHDRAMYIDADGCEKDCWAKLTSPQMDWYRTQIDALRERGCDDTTMIMHIPFYAYWDAYEAAFRVKTEEERRKITLAQAVPGGSCWNEGYEASRGVQYESIGSYSVDDGVFEIVKASESTKHVIVGHDHVNNWQICYQGIQLIYALKTGAGCYWTPELNGGTVVRIGKNGVEEVYHEYVDISDILKQTNEEGNK